MFYESRAGCLPDRKTDVQVGPTYNQSCQDVTRYSISGNVHPVRNYKILHYTNEFQLKDAMPVSFGLNCLHLTFNHI